MRDGTIRPFNYTKQTYIRNMIHHPENVHNARYSDAELKQSIEEMASIAKTLH